MYLHQLTLSFAKPHTSPHTSPQEAKGDDESAAHDDGSDAMRSWVIEQLTSAARLPNASQDSITEAAKILALHAFCTVDPGKASKVSYLLLEIAGSFHARELVSSCSEQFLDTRLIVYIGRPTELLLP